MAQSLGTLKKYGVENCLRENLKLSRFIWLSNKILRALTSASKLSPCGLRCLPFFGYGPVSTEFNFSHGTLLAFDGEILHKILVDFMILSRNCPSLNFVMKLNIESEIIKYL